MEKQYEKKINSIVLELNRVQMENPYCHVRNIEIKKKIATVCLCLIENTPPTNDAIVETSETITGKFGWCDYNDKLDEIIDIAGELELPAHHVSGDVQKLWKRMKIILNRYLLNIN